MKFKWLVRLLLFGVLIPSFAQKNKKTDVRPNIILIMVDDLGFSDIAPFGSEIETPNLSELAAEGIRFREFYNKSICAPTRASLITGQQAETKINGITAVAATDTLLFNLKNDIGEKEIW